MSAKRILEDEVSGSRRKGKRGKEEDEETGRCKMRSLKNRTESEKNTVWT